MFPFLSISRYLLLLAPYPLHLSAASALPASSLVLTRSMVRTRSASAAELSCSSSIFFSVLGADEMNDLFILLQFATFSSATFFGACPRLACTGAGRDCECKSFSLGGPMEVFTGLDETPAGDVLPEKVRDEWPPHPPACGGDPRVLAVHTRC